MSKKSVFIFLSVFLATPLFAANADLPYHPSADDSCEPDTAMVLFTAQRGIVLRFNEQVFNQQLAALGRNRDPRVSPEQIKAAAQQTAEVKVKRMFPNGTPPDKNIVVTFKMKMLTCQREAANSANNAACGIIKAQH